MTSEEMLLNTSSETENLRQQLMRAQRLSSVGTLASSVAHEFNNILTTIINYSKLGLKPNATDATKQQALEKIHKASQRAATIVGSMATVWHGVVNPPRPGTIREWRYDDKLVVLERGAEMGRFLLGSTVVMLFPHDTLRFSAAWAPEKPVRMGEAMALAV